MPVRVQNAPMVIYLAFCLHNYCVRANAPEIDDGYVEPPEDDEDGNGNGNGNGNGVLDGRGAQYNLGRLRREALVRDYCQ